MPVHEQVVSIARLSSLEAETPTLPDYKGCQFFLVASLQKVEFAEAGARILIFHFPNISFYLW